MASEFPEWWKNFWTGPALEQQRSVKPEQTRAEADFIEKMLCLPLQSKILDIPCGEGRLSIELAARSYQVTGVDLSQPLIKDAQSKSA